MTKAKESRKRKVRTDADAGATAPAADVQQAAPAPVSDAQVKLGPSLEIKDVEAAHRELMSAIGSGRPTCVDIGGVASVDSAGIQLLVALHAAAQSGLPLKIYGESAAVAQASKLLGVGSALQPTASRD